MLKIKTIKSAGFILVTLTAIFLLNIKIVSAQEKPTDTLLGMYFGNPGI
jgi:hypothetical protein